MTAKTYDPVAVRVMIALQCVRDMKLAPDDDLELSFSEFCANLRPSGSIILRFGGRPTCPPVALAPWEGDEPSWAKAWGDLAGDIAARRIDDQAFLRAIDQTGPGVILRNLMEELRRLDILTPEAESEYVRSLHDDN